MFRVNTSYVFFSFCSFREYLTFFLFCGFHFFQNVNAVTTLSFFLVKSLGARRFLLLTLELRNLSCDIRLWTVLTELHVQPFIMVWNLPGVSVGILSVIIYL